MKDIEEEIRLEVTKDQIKQIKDITKEYKEDTRMIDITCGKYGFDSLSKVGYICRIRQKDDKITMEIKKYLEDEKCIEKSIEIDTVEDGLEFFKLLDLTPYLTLKRNREIREYNDLLIYIDRFDDIGDYIEIEYQNSSREEALNFVKSLNIKLDFKEKYGDIARKRVNK